MQTQYIYSASRVNTLAQYLLTKTDIDRLLVAEAGDDLQSALKETYLAPYVLKEAPGDIAHAIEATLIEAKKLLHRIAPAGDMLRVLWVQYDIHNLRVFAKAKASGRNYADLSALVSARGVYEPSELYEYAEQRTLDRGAFRWQSTYDAAVQHAVDGEIGLIDGLFDQLLFVTIQEIAATAKDAFITKYVHTTIDLYNLKSRLRALQIPAVAATALFVPGGSFDQQSIATAEQVIALFSRFENAAFWSESLDTFTQTSNSTMLDAKVDEYVVGMAKQASVDMFSSASLVLFYLQSRQSAANVRTIVVGKNSGMAEADIRSNLRLAYVNQ